MLGSKREPKEVFFVNEFILPHLFVAVLLERRLPVALLPLGSLLLLLLGLRGQYKLLRYLLLRYQLRHGTRLPVCFSFIKKRKDRKKEFSKDEKKKIKQHRQ